MITKEQLIAWDSDSVNVAETVVEYFNKYAEQYSVNTPLRIAAFLAQVIEESGSFKYLTEIASGAAYEGRKDLGNTQPGDGKSLKEGAIFKSQVAMNILHYLNRFLVMIRF